MLSKTLLASTLVFASGVFTACSDTPAAPVQASSFVRFADFDDIATRWDTTRSFLMLAGTQDSMTPYSMDKRLPGVITTSGGDQEQLLLGRRVCDDGYKLCQSLVVSLVPTADLTDLTLQIDRQGARFSIISVSGYAGGVFVYDHRDLARVALWLSRRPEVRFVEQNGLAFCGMEGCGPTQAIFSVLNGGIRLRARTGTPSHFDNHLEVQPGDTITVSFEQPDGTFFRFQEVARPWGTGGVIGSR